MLLATVDYGTGKLAWHEDELYTAEMLLDNARIHDAKLLAPFLGEMKERLEIVFLPPYSPQFNIVEGLWKWLKSDVIKDSVSYCKCQIISSTYIE